MTKSDILKSLCITDFLTFAERAHLELYGRPIALNWSHEAIAWVLHLIFGQRRQEQVICVPPRSLKTFLILIAFPAWLLGRDPTIPMVCASYNMELSEKPARDCQRLMKTKFYRELFPATRISTRSAGHDFETTRGGGRLSTSVGGVLTGRGGRLLIIDDPLKADEANSETARKRVIDWYTTTAITRLDDKVYGATILVMQRLHEDDLAGHLIRSGAPELRLPAIADEAQEVRLSRRRVYRRKKGELLHPAREPLRVLDKLRATMPAHVFEAQYQQNPVPAAGNLILAAWLKRYDTMPSRQDGGQIFQSWDTASKDNPWNDYSVCITALKRGNQLYILDVFRERLKFHELYDKAIELARRWGAQILLVEDAGSGQQLCQELERTKPMGVPGAVPVSPVGSKMVRMDGQTASIAAGDLLLPMEAPWLVTFEHELLGFPNGKHDDQVDALSQLMSFIRSMPGPVTFGMPVTVAMVSVEEMLEDGYDPMADTASYLEDEEFDLDDPAIRELLKDFM